MCTDPSSKLKERFSDCGSETFWGENWTLELFIPHFLQNEKQDWSPEEKVYNYNSDE